MKLTTEHSTNNMELQDGSHIAVIGGGPAGSFFSYFALDFAQRFGLDIHLDIIEAKDFNKIGPAGCNHCGGIVSESLIQMLSAEGIVLPSNVIRRGIESYTLHLEQGTHVIETPLKEQRIAAMFRGFGPLGSSDSELLSFDNHLLDLCQKMGANIIIDRVTEAKRTEDGIILRTKNNQEKKYDLVVGAVGLNPNTLNLFKSISPKFESPGTTKTYICEFEMPGEVIDEYFGNSMHVFLLNLPHIKFGALIPKGNYVTLVLLGSEISKDIVENFMNSKAVKDCFPPDLDLNKVTTCHCFPKVNIRGARSAYADRVILIGDSASSKLYKNGIGAAYMTGKAAAKTVIFNGVSKKDFNKYYQPVCRELNLDNALGKFIFMVTSVIQKSSYLKSSMLKTVNKEQRRMGQNRRMSAVLWDTFTGSAPYKDVFFRCLHPAFLASLGGSMVQVLFNKNSTK